MNEETIYKKLIIDKKNCFLCSNGKNQRRYSVFTEGFNLRVFCCLPCLMHLKEQGIDIQQTVKDKIKKEIERGNKYV